MAFYHFTKENTQCGSTYDFVSVLPHEKSIHWPTAGRDRISCPKFQFLETIGMVALGISLVREANCVFPFVFDVELSE